MQSEIETRLSKLPQLLSGKQAAAALGIEPKTLANWRSTGRYPLPFVKIGGLVRYKSDALLAFIQSRTRGEVAETER